MALNVLFCADMLRPLDLVPLTEFTYKYQSTLLTGQAQPLHDWIYECSTK